MTNKFENAFTYQTVYRKSDFVKDLEQTPFFLKSDLNINNFAVLFHFLITWIFIKIEQYLEIAHNSIFFY